MLTRRILIWNRLKTPKSTENNDFLNNDDVIKIYVRVPYAGQIGENLLKACIRKLRRFTKLNVIFITLFDTKKFAMFCPTKDKIPSHQRANVIYKLSCPGCGNKYVGKTDRCLITRLLEHGTRVDQPIIQHLTRCDSFHDYVNIFSLPSNDMLFDINTKEHIKNAVLSNFEIVDWNSNWSQLLFLEAFYIKRFSPAINKGLKASKELQLFT